MYVNVGSDRTHYNMFLALKVMYFLSAHTLDYV